jgi:hypothetical protein
MHRCMHSRVNSGGANKTLMELQDLEKPLSDYGMTSATRILVLKHADNAAKRAMDAALERDIRIKRLRQCSALLWLSFVQLPNNRPS